MNAAELLVHLRMLDVDVSVHGERLDCNAPAGVLDAELRSAIASNKAELIRLVREQPAAPREAPAPLSYAQERMWILDRLQGSVAAYNIPSGVRFKGTFDAAAAERAISAIVERHAILRTTYEMRDGEPVQVVHPPSPVTLHRTDLSALDAGERARTVMAETRREASTPFDLSTGPVFRVRLLRLASDDHIVLSTAHHIASDAWSMEVFIREFAELYAAFVTGRPPGLKPIPVQYADFARWQRRNSLQPSFESQRAYWRRKLAGAIPPLDLPLDRPRPAVQTFEGSNIRVIVPPATANGLRALAQQEQTSLLIVLLGAFAVWLSRHTGERDISIGTPVAGRTRLALEQIIGFFVNTLVIRSSVRTDLTFREFVREMRSVALEAFANQDVQFEQVVEDLHLPRDRSRNPLFQVMLTYARTNPAALSLPDIEASSPEWVAGATAKFDLTAQFLDTPEGLELILEYATALFDHRTADRFASRLTSLLEEAAKSPDTTIARLPIFAADELALLDKWSRGPAAELRHSTAHGLVADASARRPDAIAVDSAGESITFAQLESRAARFAAQLRAAGVGPGTLVGVSLPRSVDMVVALYGVWKAGAAFIPMDPAYPSNRLTFMVSDAGARVIVCTPAQFAALGSPAGVVRISPAEPVPAADAPESADTAADLAATNPALDDDALAYVAYTSGSTGQPKGARITHRGLVNYLQWAVRAYQIEHGDGAPVHSSIAFDLTVTSLWGSLAAGRTAFLTAEGDGVDGLAEALRSDRHFSLVKLTPSHLELLREQHASRPLTSPVGVFVVGGEQLMHETVAYWRSVMPGARFVNEYGPTETVVGCCVQSVMHDRESGPVPIGSPIDNTTLLVLDDSRERVPIGVPGELYIGGAGVAHGYHERPELSAERFVKLADGGRFYRTGDLVRYRADGTLEFLGRTDFQVKLRGFRIELGEIESAIVDAHAASQAVVVLREDTPGDQRLVAYVVAPAESRDGAALRDALRPRLPQYMIPAHFVFLDELPLAPTGKVDRGRLPAPIGGDDHREYDEPRTATERALAREWSELLHLDRVGRDDNFFELGGHSLLAVKLVERLRATGPAPDVRAVFLAPTLAEFAARLDEIRQGGAARTRLTVPPAQIPAACSRITPDMLPLISLRQAEIDNIVRAVPGGAANVKDILPLTPQQEGVLFHRLVAGPAAPDTYQQRVLIAADTKAHATQLLGLLQSAVNRHEALRTMFLAEGVSRAVQVIVRQAEVPVDEVRVLLGETVEDALMRATDPRAVRLDLSVAPPQRAFLAQSDGHWGVGVVLHHIAVDHVSLEVLMREIIDEVAGSLPDETPAMSYRDFVGATIQRASEADEAYFRALLGDVSEPTLMYGIGDVRADVTSLREAAVPLDAEVSRRVRRAASAHGVTPAALFHLAWALVVARTAGRDDVVFGTVLLGRSLDLPGVENVVGMLINTLPVRVELGGRTMREAVRRTHDQLARLLAHEQAPLVVAQRCSNVPAQSPLFTSLLNYRRGSRANTPDGPAVVAGIRPMMMEERTNYPFTVNVDDFGDDFAITAQCVQSVNPVRLADYLATAVSSLVAALEATPDAVVLDLDVMPASERERIARWNGTHRAYDLEQPLHRLVEAQVDSTPSAPALRFENEVLTYADLDGRANQLAHALRERGVGPDSLVGVCMERSVELVVALLGVLKAGGAYVPLDPALPDARLAYLADDADVSFIVTQQATLERTRHLRGDRIVLDARDAGADAIPLASYSRERIREQMSAGNLAYMIYTSGSTGQPKGALNTHRGIVNRLCWMQDAYRLNSGDRVLQKTPFSFDVSVWEFFWPLIAGAQIIVARPEGHRDPEYLVQIIREQQVTTTHFVPSMLPAFLEAPGAADCTSLRRVIMSGEAMSAALRDAFFARLPACELHNLYGPTEAAVDVSAWRCAPADTDSTVPIGYPIANIQLHLLDARQRPVPVSATGEIYIGGVGVGRGYHKRPELTAERFVPDPFSADPNARMYRTGDLAKYRPDGALEYLGRTDFQVKLRGFRIELGEIEATLRSVPWVREAVAVAQPAPAGDQRLVAYVVADAAVFSIAELRSAAAKTLPSYMVPAAFVRLDQLPLTPNGKLDRKSLPAPDDSAIDTRRAFVEPQADHERRLARHLEQVLGVERVGLNDDFFELGGHSITATRIAGWIREEFGIEFPVYAIFEAPSVAAIAARIGAALTTAPAPTSTPPREELEL